MRLIRTRRWPQASTWPSTSRNWPGTAKKPCKIWWGGWCPRDLPTLATIVTGEAAKEIVAFAAREQIDLIVIATHGLTGWKHFLTGSVAEKVVRGRACAVLTIRSRAEKQEK